MPGLRGAKSSASRFALGIVDSNGVDCPITGGRFKLALLRSFDCLVVSAFVLAELLGLRPLGVSFVLGGLSSGLLRRVGMGAGLDVVSRGGTRFD